jgi:hypothetical protein
MKTTRVDESISNLPEPTINPMTVDYIINATENTKKDAVIHAITTDPHLIKLEELMKIFIDIQSSLSLAPGLNKQQLHELQVLTAHVKELDSHIQKTDFDIDICKQAIATEKRIVSFHRTIDWWRLNLIGLRKKEVWNNIHLRTQEMCNNHGELAAVAQQKLMRLAMIKNNWAKHHAFAGTTSESLLLFYTHYICPLEELMTDELTSKRKYPTLIRDFIEREREKLRAIKRHAIYSMLARLQCAEFYHDMECDDVLIHLCDQIELTGNITLTDHAKKTPGPRRSLNAGHILTFIDVIETYCEKKEYDIALELKKLTMTWPPTEWRSLSVNNPILNITAHTFPSLLEQAMHSEHLANAVLNGTSLEESTFILKNIQSLLQQTMLQYKTVSKKLRTNSNPIKRMINLYDKQFYDALSKINNIIESQVEIAITTLIDDTFKNNFIDKIHLAMTLQKLHHATEYNRLYMQDIYYPYYDVVLSIAMRIKMILAHGGTITPTQCNNIDTVLTALYPQASEAQQQDSLQRLHALPGLLQRLPKDQPNQWMQFLLFYLELPFLADHGFTAPLQRHMYMAKQTNERWPQEIKDLPGQVFIPSHLLQQLTYIKLAITHPDAINHSTATAMLTHIQDELKKQYKQDLIPPEKQSFAFITNIQHEVDTLLTNKTFSPAPRLSKATTTLFHEPAPALANMSISHLQLSIEQFALTRFSKTYLPAFKKACNDPQFGTDRIKQEWKVKKDGHAHEIILLMSLYRELKTPLACQKMIGEMLRIKNFSPTFNTFLTTLQSLPEKNTPPDALSARLT